MSDSKITPASSSSSIATGPIPLHVARTRPRANTADLSPPKPENNPNDYTIERLNAGVQYAEQRLQSKTRKPTPQTEKVLGIYLSTCRDAIQKKTDTTLPSSEINKILEDVREMESDLSYRAWLIGIGKLDDLQHALICLREARYLALYGDYLEMMTREFKGRALNIETSSTEYSAKHLAFQKWTEISENIELEKVQWTLEGSAKPELVKTTYAIFNSCRDLGLEFAPTVKLIHLYADRNRKFHSGINVMIEKGDFAGVASTLYHDLQELSRVIPVKRRDEETLVRSILLELKDRWFEQFIPEVPGSWIPTEELKAEFVAKDPAKKAKAQEERVRCMRESAIKAFKELEKNEQLFKQMETPNTPRKLPSKGFPTTTPSSKKRGKRKAQEYTPKTRRKKLFEEVMSKVDHARRLHKTSLEVMGEANHIAVAYRSEYGSSPPKEN
jgi:hypothetical protein